MGRRQEKGGTHVGRLIADGQRGVDSVGGAGMVVPDLGEGSKTVEQTEGAARAQGSSASITGDSELVRLGALAEGKLGVLGDGEDRGGGGVLAGELDVELAELLGLAEFASVDGTTAYDETLELVVLELGVGAGD